MNKVLKQIKQITIKNLISAFRKVKSNPDKVVLALICDVFFFIAYGFFTSPIFTKIVEYAAVIGSIVSEKAPTVLRGTNPSIGSIVLSNPEARRMFNSILLLYLLLVVVVYLIYIFFQGVSWKISSSIAGRKISMHQYMKEFALLNVFWIVLFMIQHFISLLAALRQAVLRSFQVEGSRSFAIFVAVLLFAIFYFAFLSYTLIGKYTIKEKIKKSFYLGIRKINYMLPAYAVIAIAYFILKYILALAGSVDFRLMIALGIMIVMPAMTIVRVYLTLVAEKVEKTR